MERRSLAPAALFVSSVIGCTAELDPSEAYDETTGGPSSMAGSETPTNSATGGTSATAGSPMTPDGNAPAGTGATTAGTGGSMGPTIGSGGTTGTTPPGECEGIQGILSESEFNQLFPNRDAAYTYQGMVDAAEGAGDLIGFPGFASEGSCDDRKRELAAFLANVARETGWLRYIEQINQSSRYCRGTAADCPAGEFEYFGRGPIQLSWNYNYEAASQALFGDDRLWRNPDLVAEDPAVAWATGFWFWMIGGAGGDGSNSPHAAMIQGWGFGETIDIINGYEECNGGTQPYAQEAVSQRVCSYEKYTEFFGVDVGPGSLDCGTSINRSFCAGI